MRRFFALILAALLLCGCAAAPQQSAETTAQTTAAPQTVSWDSLTFTGPRPMHYAETFATNAAGPTASAKDTPW